MGARAALAEDMAAKETNDKETVESNKRRSTWTSPSTRPRIPRRYPSTPSTTRARCKYARALGISASRSPIGATRSRSRTASQDKKQSRSTKLIGLSALSGKKLACHCWPGEACHVGSRPRPPSDHPAGVDFDRLGRQGEGRETHQRRSTRSGRTVLDRSGPHPPKTGRWSRPMLTGDMATTPAPAP